jgi:hypothetical protein
LWESMAAVFWGLVVGDAGKGCGAVVGAAWRREGGDPATVATFAARGEGPVFGAMWGDLGSVLRC